MVFLPPPGFRFPWGPGRQGRGRPAGAEGDGNLSAGSGPSCNAGTGEKPGARARQSNGLPVELQLRMREALQMASAGVAWWYALHAALALAVFLLPTGLHSAAMQPSPGNAFFLAAYGTLFLATILQYYFLSQSSPGYVDEVSTAFDQPTGSAGTAVDVSAKPGQASQGEGQAQAQGHEAGLSLGPEAVKEGQECRGGATGGRFSGVFPLSQNGVGVIQRCRAGPRSSSEDRQAHPQEQRPLGGKETPTLEKLLALEEGQAQGQPHTQSPALDTEQTAGKGQAKAEGCEAEPGEQWEQNSAPGAFDPGPPLPSPAVPESQPLLGEISVVESLVSSGVGRALGGATQRMAPQESLKDTLLRVWGFGAKEDQVAKGATKKGHDAGGKESGGLRSSNSGSSVYSIIQQLSPGLLSQQGRSAMSSPLLPRTLALPREEEEKEKGGEAIGEAQSRTPSSLPKAPVGEHQKWGPQCSKEQQMGSRRPQHQILQEAGADPLLLNWRPAPDAQALAYPGQSQWRELLQGRSLRTCRYCEQLQPVRAKHCYDCGRCVLQFDHHCSWVGTCIGWRNHRQFWIFLLLDSCLVLWTLVADVSALDWSTASKDNWLPYALALFLALLLLLALAFLSILLGFHSYLILTNQTTYEATQKSRIPYLRQIPNSVHPFSRGPLQNLFLGCCLPQDVLPLYLIPIAQAKETDSSSTR